MPTILTPGPLVQPFAKAVKKWGMWSMPLMLLLFASVIGLVSQRVQNSSQDTRAKANIVSATIPTIGYQIDKILGQPNEHETMYNQVVGNRGFHLTSVHIDNLDRIYVMDSGNNRILGYNSFPQDPDQAADMVLGQPSLLESSTVNGSNTMTQNPTAATLGFQPAPYLISQEESPRFMQMATDSENNLYVVDNQNNRVLKYIDPFTTDQIADNVWGQPDFTSNQSGCGYNGQDVKATTLCTTWNGVVQVLGTGVDIDQAGNLWVTDTGNHRVLRFPSGSKTADLVLGQPNFTSYTLIRFWNRPSSTMYKPVAIRVKPETGEVYVLEGEVAGETKILVFSPPFTNGMSPTRVIGQADMQDTQPPDTTNWEAVTLSGMTKWVHLTSGLNLARGLTLDTSGNGDVWVNDSLNNRVLLFDQNGEMVNVLGQASFDTRFCDGTPTPGFQQVTGERANFCQSYGEIGIDTVGQLFVSQTYYPRNISRFVTPLTRNTEGLVISNGQMLHQEMGKRWNQISGKTFGNAYGLAISSNTSPPQLFVADKQRILVWNNFQNTTTFQPADYVIGYDDFTSNLDNTGLFGDQQITALDVHGGYIWVGTEHKIFVFSTPVTGGGSNYPLVKTLETNENVFWADDATPAAFDASGGLYYDAVKNALWVSDPTNNRVIHIANPLGTATIDLVLGQPTKTSVGDNASEGDAPNAHGFGKPWSLNMDTVGNLYVVDSSYEGGWDGANDRVVRFSASSIDPQSYGGNIFPLPNAVGVYAKVSLNSDDNWGPHTPTTPTYVTFDSQNRMLLLTDSYGNEQWERAFVYEPNHVNETAPQPNYILPIPFGQTAMAHFYPDDSHLAIQDLTWNRMLSITIPQIYPTPPPTPTPSPVNYFFNPSFELGHNGDGTTPLAWFKGSNSDSNDTLTDEQAHDGTHAYRIIGTTIKPETLTTNPLYNNGKWPANSVFNLSGWAKSTTVGNRQGTATLTFTYENGTKSKLTITIPNVLNQWFKGGGAAYTSGVVTKAVLTITYPRQNGTMYFDDFQLTITPPGNTPLYPLVPLTRADADE